MASPGLRMPRWALFVWMALLLGAIALLWWRSDRSLAEEARKAMLVAEMRTLAAAPALMECLSRLRPDALGLAGEGPDWGGLKGAPDTKRAHDAARQIRLDVVDRGAERLLRVYTRDARPLRAIERAVLERCLAA